MNVFFFFLGLVLGSIISYFLLKKAFQKKYLSMQEEYNKLFAAFKNIGGEEY